MYIHDKIDHAILRERAAEFRDQVARRLRGEITEDEFKRVRLQNGVHLQRHSYMLRVDIPYGTLSSAQMRRLAAIALRYDRGYGHFTTRQNIQFNWVKLAELPDALAELSDVGCHAIQTSGNNLRSITCDPWAGVAPGEVEDPRVFAEILGQHNTSHPEFSSLPRKFKIAITASKQDRVALRIHDLGLRLIRKEDGETGFEVVVGGGLGRSPFIAQLLSPYVAACDIVSYVEAVLRVYNQHGRRDNIHKARIKILVHDLGITRFAAQVEEEWQKIRDGALRLTAQHIDSVRARFIYPRYVDLEDRGEDLPQAGSDSRFMAWLKNSVFPHRAPGYAIVTISLKPAGSPPGDASASQMAALADLAERYSSDEIRVTPEQNLLLPHVAKRDLHELWRALDALELATPNINLITDIISCPGLDYCAKANARSIPLAQELTQRFAAPERADSIGPMHIHISGCSNACAQHHIGNIGILGIDRQGEEFYQITIGGRADETTAIGAQLGPAVRFAEVTGVIEGIVEAYLALRQRPDEAFADVVARLGVEAFVARIQPTG